MDLLKRELQKKRKAARLESTGKCYVRWSELEEKQQLQERREEHRPKASPLAPSSSLEHELVGLPRHEVIRRLRVLREPATLFGEGDAARAHRLRLALRSRAATDDSRDFLGDTIQTRKRHKAAGVRDAERRAGERAGGAAGEEGADDGDVKRRGDDDADAGKESKSMVEAKFDELCEEDKILVFFSRRLDEWKQQLDGMSELEKRTANGKRKVARFNQSAQSLAALFEFCRKKVRAHSWGFTPKGFAYINNYIFCCISI